MHVHPVRTRLIIPRRLACVLCTYCIILELSWCEQFGDSYWKKVVNLSTSCHSFTRVQNSSFHVVDRTKTSATKNGKKERKKNLHSVQINYRLCRRHYDRFGSTDNKMISWS